MSGFAFSRMTTALSNALAWVALNRALLSMAESLIPAGPSGHTARTPWDAALVSVLKDIRACRLGEGWVLPGEQDLLCAFEAARREACHGVADPTAGARSFYPHWLEPPDADRLTATALIGPLVFFAPRVNAALVIRTNRPAESATPSL